MTLDPLAARTLKRAHESVREAPDSPEARARSVAAMQAAMGEAPVRRARRGVQALALAAGLGALLAGGLALRPEAAGRVVSTGGAFATGHRFDPGERVESGASPLALELASGIALSLAPQSTVRLGTTPVEVHIEHGEVAAEIAPRETPFSLECADTRVFTRGARVKISPGGGCDGRTRIEVLDGEATLADGSLLRRSEIWPRCAAALRLIAPAPAPEVVTVEPPRPAPPTPRAQQPAPKTAPPAPAAPAAPPETARAREERLARQNALYLEALSLQRSGQIPAALERLSDILSDPTSPLAETALAQKMRWLSSGQRRAARESAHEYLRRFPMGFARAEAEALVLEQP